VPAGRRLARRIARTRPMGAIKGYATIASAGLVDA
jgi:hypothetical protein